MPPRWWMNTADTTEKRQGCLAVMRGAFDARGLDMGAKFWPHYEGERAVDYEWYFATPARNRYGRLEAAAVVCTRTDTVREIKLLGSGVAGAGRELLRQLLARLFDSKHYRVVVLETVSAEPGLLNFYKSMGFVDCDGGGGANPLVRCDAELLHQTDKQAVTAVVDSAGSSGRIMVMTSKERGLTERLPSVLCSSAGAGTDQPASDESPRGSVAGQEARPGARAAVRGGGALKAPALPMTCAQLVPAVYADTAAAQNALLRMWAAAVKAPCFHAVAQKLLSVERDVTMEEFFCFVLAEYRRHRLGEKLQAVGGCFQPPEGAAEDVRVKAALTGTLRVCATGYMRLDVVRGSAVEVAWLRPKIVGGAGLVYWRSNGSVQVAPGGSAPGASAILDAGDMLDLPKKEGDTLDAGGGAVARGVEPRLSLEHDFLFG